MKGLWKSSDNHSRSCKKKYYVCKDEEVDKVLVENME
jgi:hypothetical protein